MKFKNTVTALAFFIFIVMYFSASDTVTDGVKQGLDLCYNIVIPSLYPFMVIAAVIASSSLADAVSLPFVYIFKLLNINNRRVMTYCILSIVGGFATGGYFLNYINETEHCPQNIYKILPVIVTCNSPAFVIVAVGLHMMDSINSGIALYTAVLVSAYITAFILSFVFPFEDKSTNDTISEKHISLSKAISDSVSSMLNICGVVIVVSALCQVVTLYSKNILVTSAFSVFCEVTAACNFIAMNFDKNIYFICFTLCFLPVSSYMQIKSFDKNNIIKLEILIISKMIQIPVALAVLRIIVNLFPAAVDVYASGDVSVNLYWNSPHLSFFLFLLSGCFVVFFDKKRTDCPCLQHNSSLLEEKNDI